MGRAGAAEYWAKRLAAALIELQISSGNRKE